MTSSFSLRRIEDYAGTHLMLPVYSAHDRDRCGKIVVISAMVILKCSKTRSLRIYADEIYVEIAFIH